MKVDGPFLLYQTTIPRFNVDFYIDSAFTSIGNICFLTMSRMESNETSEPYLATISFQDSGSVSNVNNIVNFMGIKVEDTIKFNYLFYGGYLIRILKKIENSDNLITQGFILDNGGNYNGTWNFPQDLILPTDNTFVSYRNGTSILGYNENDYTWKLSFADMQRFIPNSFGYDNPNIKLLIRQLGQLYHYQLQI